MKFAEISEDLKNVTKTLGALIAVVFIISSIVREHLESFFTTIPTENYFSTEAAISSVGSLILISAACFLTIHALMVIENKVIDARKEKIRSERQTNNDNAEITDNDNPEIADAAIQRFSDDEWKKILKLTPWTIFWLILSLVLLVVLWTQLAAGQSILNLTILVYLFMLFPLVSIYISKVAKKAPADWDAVDVRKIFLSFALISTLFTLSSTFIWASTIRQDETDKKVLRWNNQDYFLISEKSKYIYAVDCETNSLLAFPKPLNPKSHLIIWEKNYLKEGECQNKNKKQSTPKNG